MKIWSVVVKIATFLLTWFGGLKEILFKLAFEEVRVASGPHILFDKIGKGGEKAYRLFYNQGKTTIYSYNVESLYRDKKVWFLLKKIPVYAKVEIHANHTNFFSIFFPRFFLKQKDIFDFLLKEKPCLPPNYEDIDLCEDCLRDFSAFCEYPPLENFLGTFKTCFHKQTDRNYYWNKELEPVLKQIAIFFQSRQWYEDRGIPYRFGILMYGEPGNGKSRLIDFLIAAYNMTRVELKSNNGRLVLEERLGGSYRKILVIEDYDCIFKGRDNISGNMKGTFAELLALIDGFQGLVIITTNHLSSIDPAIGLPKRCEKCKDLPENCEECKKSSTRPGRIHRVIEMKKPEEETRRKIAKKIFYGFPEMVEEQVLVGQNDTYAQFTDRCATLSLEKFWSLKV